MKFVWDIANGELKDVKTQTFGEKFSIAGMDRDLNIPTKVAEVDKDLYQDFNWPGHMIHESEGGQLGQEEYYRRESIPHSERPITGKDGGLIRQGFAPQNVKRVATVPPSNIDIPPKGFYSDVDLIKELGIDANTWSTYKSKQNPTYLRAVEKLGEPIKISTGAPGHASTFWNVEKLD